MYINTGQEFDGSDSGARPDEAVSWGKIKIDGESVKVYADATLVFPLIISGSESSLSLLSIPHSPILDNSIWQSALGSAEEAGDDSMNPFVDNCNIIIRTLSTSPPRPLLVTLSHFSHLLLQWRILVT